MKCVRIIIGFVTLMPLFVRPSFSRVIWGPVVGNVHFNGATVKIAFDRTTPATLQLFADSSHTAFIQSFQASPQFRMGDTLFTFQLAGLLDGFRYYYLIINGSDSAGGSFRTFPVDTDQPFRIAFGSCIAVAGIFRTIEQYDVDLTILIGDWGYYDHAPGSVNDRFFIPDDTLRLRDVWRTRYSMPVLKDYIASHNMAYIWDDHDFTAVDASKNAVVFYDIDTFNAQVDVYKVFYNQNTRANAMYAYRTYFPHYPFIFPELGLTQKIGLPVGTAYLLDVRSNRDSHIDAFQKTANRWQFNPPVDHSMLGDTLKNWLLDDLQSNSGTWKGLFSSVVFNRKLQDLVTRLLALQTIQPLLAATAIGMGDAWYGYPSDQLALLDLIQNQNIQNVFIGTGDIHTSGIDDGENAGIPEIVAANLGQTNSRLFQLLDVYTNGNARQYWNKGGQGIGNQNFNYAFGLITFYGEDSCRLEVVDINRTIVCSHTMYNPAVSTSGIKSASAPRVIYLAGRKKIIVQVNPFCPVKRVALYALDGRLMLSGNTSAIDVANLPGGVYLTHVRCGNRDYIQKVCVY